MAAHDDAERAERYANPEVLSEIRKLRQEMNEQHHRLRQELIKFLERIVILETEMKAMRQDVEALRTTAAHFATLDAQVNTLQDQVKGIYGMAGKLALGTATLVSGAISIVFELVSKVWTK